MSLILCGFPISNYYNKVKIALLEKGVPFVEEVVMTKSRDEAVLKDSPLAKIPFLRTDEGGICESEAILEYIESRWPTPALMPSSPYARAKVRELSTFIDLHLELLARELYPQAFFGGQVSDELKARVRKSLEKNIAAFKRLARFSPYVAGDTFSQADCSAIVSLPLVGMATKIIYGEDLLQAGGVDIKPYAKLLGERPSVAKVNADRKAATAKPA